MSKLDEPKSAETQNQIDQMVAFIMAEAQDKIQEIEFATRNQSDKLRLRLMQFEKEKLLADYEKKKKQLDGKKALDVSRAKSAARIEAINEKNKLVESVITKSREKLLMTTRDQAKYKTLVSDLITQGLLKLIEPDVLVRCRAADRAVVDSVLTQASIKYSEILKQKTGVNKSVNLSIDSEVIPVQNDVGEASCGGVILMTPDKRIVIDNTLDGRLQLVSLQCLPAIRTLLFVN